MQKKYLIRLDDYLLGFSYLENNDAPMGVVFGKIHFEKITSGYDFFSSYCEKYNIPTNENNSKIKSINTQSIDGLTIISEDGVEIKGIGASIIGNDDEFMVEVLGIPYPFYSEEFPHHVEASENHYRKTNVNPSKEQ